MVRSASSRTFQICTALAALNLFTTLVAGTASLCTSAISGAGSRNPIGLELVPSKGVMLGSRTRGVVEFGIVESQSQSRYVTRNVQVRNRGGSTVTIGEVVTTCHCTSVVTINNQELRGVPLAPGSVTTLTVRMDRTRAAIGRDDKFILIYARDAQGPAITLEVRATVVSPVQFHPSALHIGVVPCGAERSYTVAAALSGGLSATVADLDLRGPGISVRIAPVIRAGTARSVDATVQVYGISVHVPKRRGCFSIRITSAVVPGVAVTVDGVAKTENPKRRRPLEP